MHIYLAEPENFARDTVAQHLRDLGHRVSLRSALEELPGALEADVLPDLIIADLAPSQGSPTSEALQLVHRRYPTIPVILRVSSEVLSATEAVQCGVHGYLSKPFRADELELMLVRLAERRLNDSLQDTVSGLYHRDGFVALAQQQLRAARRTHTEMMLLRADFSGMDAKETEQAIRDLGQVVQRTFRDADMAGRVDSNECGVLLVNAGAKQSDVALNRLQQSLAAHNANASNELNVRLGVAHFDPDQPCSFEELVAQADAGSVPNDSSRL